MVSGKVLKCCYNSRTIILASGKTSLSALYLYFPTSYLGTK